VLEAESPEAKELCDLYTGVMELWKSTKRFPCFSIIDTKALKVDTLDIWETDQLKNVSVIIYDILQGKPITYARYRSAVYAIRCTENCIKERNKQPRERGVKKRWYVTNE
jgi:hypothetical protein